MATLSAETALPLATTRPASFPRAFFWACFCSIAFIFVYGFCNTFTHHRFLAGQHVPTLYFEWERQIPVIPLFIIPYMSIDLFFFVSFFLCADLGELRTHAKRILLAITIAGTFFLLFPLQYGFDRPSEIPGVLGHIFKFLHSFDYPYNLAPSLHIAFRSIIWMVYIRHTRSVTRWAVRIWLILVGLSTLFVKQHHVIDLLTGQILAMFCFYLFPDPVAPSERITSSDHLSRNTKVAAFYSAGFITCLVAGVCLKMWGWVMIWPAFALAMLALAYSGFGPEIFHKSKGQLPLTTRWLLAPYLLGSYLSSLRYRSAPAYAEIVPNLLVGRKLTNPESRHAIDSGVNAILDLTAEFSESREFRNLPYRNVQVLDLTLPTVEQLRQCTDFISAHIHSGKVYVHCAIGYSRSAAVAAAWLLASGSASDPQSAIAQVKKSKPNSVFSPGLVPLLQEFQESIT